jgi:hypothetical protein
MVIYTCNPSYSGEGTEEGRGGKRREEERKETECHLLVWLV